MGMSLEKLSCQHRSEVAKHRGPVFERARSIGRGLSEGGVSSKNRSEAPLLPQHSAHLRALGLCSACPSSMESSKNDRNALT